MQLTKGADSTDAHNADRRHGFKQDGRRPSRFTKKSIRFQGFCKKIVDTISSFGVIFLSVTIEKQVKGKLQQWQLKDAQKKLLEDLLRRERLPRERQQLENLRVKKLKRDLRQNAEDRKISPVGTR
ncbi:MAG: hypothetical protein KGI33_06080 [Thaumarchaeota archaeon]|nr:hypothetical protein [Nitrososphaerota archaeon]